MSNQPIQERLNHCPTVPGFVCPAEFWPALGYAEHARFVAIWWERTGDEAAWADGRETFVGAFWPAYHALLAHNGAALAGRDWLLGSSEEAAEYWLVIDRETEKAWLVPAEEAQDALRLQWPVADVAADGMGVLSFEQLMELVERLPRLGVSSVEEVERQMNEQDARYRALVAALDARDLAGQETETRP